MVREGGLEPPRLAAPDPKFFRHLGTAMLEPELQAIFKGFCRLSQGRRALK
jgi:hypothetical protein